MFVPTPPQKVHSVMQESDLQNSLWIRGTKESISFLSVKWQCWWNTVGWKRACGCWIWGIEVLLFLVRKLKWPEKGNSEVLLAPGDLLWFPLVGIWIRFSTVSINTVVSVSLPSQLPFSPQREARDQTFLNYSPIRHHKGREQIWQSKWCVYLNLERARLNLESVGSHK